VPAPAVAQRPLAAVWLARRSNGGAMRTVLHHLLQELNDHLGGGAHQHLALAALLSIEDAAQAVVEHRDTNHGSCVWRAGKESSARGVEDAQPLRPAGNPCPALTRRSARLRCELGTLPASCTCKSWFTLACENLVPQNGASPQECPVMASYFLTRSGASRSGDGYIVSSGEEV
jgi:hypothetical protein